MANTGTQRKWHRKMRQRFDAPPLASRADLQRIKQAVRQDWPIPGPQRARIFREVLRVLKSEQSTVRQTITAAETFVEMSAADLDALQAGRTGADG